jgi:2,3-bisphosphoglycerate-independent phosphoglycerate mutase
MARRYHRLLLLFADGIGLAPIASDNPFATEYSPTIEALVGGPLVAEQVGSGEGYELVPLDACLGVDGLPQSATGQATLFTGVNAAEHMGRHVTGLPGPRLRALVRENGVFAQIVKAGFRPVFANAYSSGYMEKLRTGLARPSVTTCVAQAAGARLRTMEDLAAGRAATWDVVGDFFSLMSDVEAPRVDPVLAGRQLAMLAARHDLTVFESFLPDLAAHGRIDIDDREVVSRLDGLLDGILGAAGDDLTVVLTSDHGNFEDRSARGHTRNPVPLLAAGPAAGRFRGLRSLTEVTPRVIDVLGGG